MTDTPKQNCVWTEDINGKWDTDCGECFAFVDGTPESNDFEFCCFCGNALLAEPEDADECRPGVRIKRNESREPFEKSPVGVPLRDWFAGKAIEGVMNQRHCYSTREIAEKAYLYADAMLVARVRK